MVVTAASSKTAPDPVLTFARSFVDWSESEIGFYVDQYWDAGRDQWHKRVAPIVWPDKQRRALEFLFTLDERGKIPFAEVWWIDIAKSAKTLIQSALMQWVSHFMERNVENALGANAKDQADMRCFKYLLDSLTWGPFGDEHLEIAEKSGYIRFLDTQNIVRSVPMRAQTIAGSNSVMLGIDEAWGMQGNRARTYFAEMKLAVTRNLSFRFLTSYPPFENDDSLLNDVLNHFFDKQGHPNEGIEQVEGLEDLPLWVCPATGQAVWWNHEPYPWHMEKDEHGYTRIDQERNKARAAGMYNQYLRIWEARRVTSNDTFVPETAWEACEDMEWEGLGRERGVPCVAAVDVGIQNDSTAISVRAYNPATQRLDLLDYRIWTPDMFPDEDRAQVVARAKDYLVKLNQRQNLLKVGYDERHFMATASELKRLGVPMDKFQQMGDRTKADTQYREYIMQHRLRNYPGAIDLKRHVLNAQMRINHDGSIRITKKGGGMIDAAVADAMCCYLCMEEPMRRRFESLVRRGPAVTQPIANQPSPWARIYKRH